MNLTLLIAATTAAVFLLQLLIPGFTAAFSLTPTKALEGSYWQFLTYMFLHASLPHIFLNMFALLIFGLSVESAMGRSNFLLLYILSGLGSAFLHLAIEGISPVPLLGASGAVFGIMAAYGILFPKNIIFAMGIPMPAILAVIFFAAAQLFFGVFAAGSSTAYFGHVGGILTGILFMGYFRLFRARTMKRWKKGVMVGEYYF
ncbi:MAG: rhomboid family intramembrane serine protease [Candidatus Aenigmarchaeota archaeon]|nr:rhomboid family intramembrane serine protease [Candidatus Aenigmarchaeota archaeon]